MRKPFKTDRIHLQFVEFGEPKLHLVSDVSLHDAVGRRIASLA
jgi:hypothetical protein